MISRGKIDNRTKFVIARAFTVIDKFSSMAKHLSEHGRSVFTRTETSTATHSVGAAFFQAPLRYEPHYSLNDSSAPSPQAGEPC